MKKILATSALALSVFLSTNALAQATSTLPAATNGGFAGPTIAPTTVEAAKKMSDESAVVLVGKIEKNLGNEKYTFTDATGSITVEIDHEDWRGQTVSPEDTVEIRGEVDKDFTTIEIDVDYVTKK